jgi:hypothetical protein
VSDQYSFLGSLNVGKIFRTEDQLVQISTTGAHAYVVRTVVWWLREAGPPAVVLDVPGLLSHIESARQGQSGGLWINVQAYDGVHAETKGEKPEFWSWNVSRKMLVAEPRR